MNRFELRDDCWAEQNIETTVIIFVSFDTFCDGCHACLTIGACSGLGRNSDERGIWPNPLRSHHNLVRLNSTTFWAMEWAGDVPWLFLVLL